ncbi:MAG: asparagine synthase (glutamine-hydrolyzing) [Elusimicrobia bacterium]|nr:asparagine synthase (glutamine-hydrolyzing) [Elusimicrobiota bacterium]
MCGFVGLLYKDAGRSVSSRELEPLLAAIRHRGPDDQGIYVDRHFGMTHARLSILDLSPLGRQPMESPDGRLVLAYNGEVYNFQELRRELEATGCRLKSRSDTEVVLNWAGLKEDWLKDLRGMFALALWDRSRQALTLARDPFGIKPLYLYEDGEKFIFSSELAGIRAHPRAKTTLDPIAVSDYLSFRYIPAPRTGFREVRKVSPASSLQLSREGVSPEKRYYEPNFTPLPRRTSGREWEERLYAELKKTVKYLLISDVPVGIFLSGGLDSSALVATASELGQNPLKTFSICGSGEDMYDERPYARLVARKFSTEHHELEFSPGDLRHILEKIVRHLGEPVSDMPSVALFYLSQLAKKEVSVVLSGEGNDEMLAGYGFEKYYFCQKYYSWLDGGPPKIAKKALKSLFPNSYWHLSSAEYLQKFLPSMVKSFSDGGVAKKDLLAEDFYPKGHDSLDLLRRAYAESSGLPFLNRILKAYSGAWLTDDLLARSDRMTMAHGLELRVPYLDHVFADLAGSLPLDQKIGFWKGKLRNRLILRKIMEGKLPEEVLTRPKAGFTLPLRRWARQDLKEYLREAFAEAPYPLKREACLKVLERHWDSPRLFNREVWQILVLILWLRGLESK